MGIAAEFDPGQKVHATEYSNNVSTIQQFSSRPVHLLTILCFMYAILLFLLIYITSARGHELSKVGV